jgi:hypothetical protein
MALSDILTNLEDIRIDDKKLLYQPPTLVFPIVFIFANPDDSHGVDLSFLQSGDLIHVPSGYGAYDFGVSGVTVREITALTTELTSSYNLGDLDSANTRLVFVPSTVRVIRSIPASRDCRLYLLTYTGGGIVFQGGDRVIVTSCEMTCNLPGDPNDTNERAVLRFNNQKRLVYAEGVDIDIDEQYGKDGILYGGNNSVEYIPDLVLQNCRILNAFSYRTDSVYGNLHSDLHQPYGKHRFIFIDKFTGSSQQQGFFDDPQHFGLDRIYRDVNLKYIYPEASNGSEEAGFLWYFTLDSAQELTKQVFYDFYLDNCWGQERDFFAVDFSASTSYPQSTSTYVGSTGSADSETGFSDGIVTWPSVLGIRGILRKSTINNGLTEIGDFVTDNVGINYVSPGYEENGYSYYYNTDDCQQWIYSDQHYAINSTTFNGEWGQIHVTDICDCSHKYNHVTCTDVLYMQEYQHRKNMITFNGTSSFLDSELETFGDSNLFAEFSDNFSVYVLATASSDGYILGKGSNGQLGLYVTNWSESNQTGDLYGICRGTSTLIEADWDGSFSFIGVIWDGTTLTYYLNDNSVSGSIGSNSIESSQNLIIGATDNGTSDFCECSILSYRVYDVALTETQWTEIYNTENEKANIDGTQSSLGTPPTVPQSLSLSENTNADLYVSWTTPASTGGQPILGYVVRYKNTALDDTNWTTVFNADTDYTIPITPDSNGYSWDVEVYAANMIGWSQGVSDSLEVGVPFVLGEVAGLVSWIEADSSIMEDTGAGSVEDGEEVGLVADKARSYNYDSMIAGEYPTYRDSIDGLPGLEFDGTNDVVRGANDATLQAITDEITLAFVMKSNAPGFADLIYFKDAGGTGIRITSNGTPALRVRLTSDAGTDSVDQTTGSGEPIIYDGEWHYAVITINGSTVKAWVDGIQVIDDTWDPGTTGFGNNTSGPVVFSKINGAGRFFTIFDNDIGDSTRIELENYMEENWMVEETVSVSVSPMQFDYTFNAGNVYLASVSVDPMQFDYTLNDVDAQVNQIVLTSTVFNYTLNDVTAELSSDEPYVLDGWKITRPVDDGGNLGNVVSNSNEILPPEILTYEDEWFDRGGGIFDFICPAGGARTSESTNYARTELRHLTNFAWDDETEMKLVWSDVDVPDGDKTVVFQTHDADAPEFKIVYSGAGPSNSDGLLRILYKATEGDSDTTIVLDNTISRGDINYIRIRRYVDELQVFLGANVDGTTPDWSSNDDVPFSRDGSNGTYYWKQGNYYQELDTPTEIGPPKIYPGTTRTTIRHHAGTWDNPIFISENSTSVSVDPMQFDYTLNDVAVDGEALVPAIESSTFASDTDSNFSGANAIDVPPGTQDGDLLLLVVSQDNAPASNPFSTPSGWSVFQSYIQDTTIGMIVFSRTASSEPSSYDLSVSNLNLSNAVMLRISGTDGTPIDVKTTNSNSSANPAVASSVTTTVDNTLVLRIATWDQSKTLTLAPSGVTEQQYVDVSGHDLWVGYEEQNSAGSTGTADWNLSSTTAWVTFTIALAPG